MSIAWGFDVYYVYTCTNIYNHVACPCVLCFND